MQIEFYTTFRKRENSTKVPDTSPARILTGYLREPCSIENPVFNIKRLSSDDAPDSYTYASIPRFGRKYFVTDWIWNNGLWECHLQEDYLGTWRTYIGATSAYVERSTSEFNTYAIDTLYPTTTEPAVSDVFINAPWTNRLISDGCYVLGVVSGTPSSIGGSVTYYALTHTQLKNLMTYLLSDAYVNDIGFPTINVEGISHNVAKALFNPIQYITSCIWFPKSVTDIGESASRPIKIGYWQVPTSEAEGHWIPAMTSQYHIDDITLPQHPLASTRGLYLNYAPYTKYTLFLPPFGQLPIDSQYFSQTDKLSLLVTFDIVTGKADLRIRKKNSDGQYWVIYSTASMFGVPIQLSQISPDFIKAGTSIASAGASMVASGAQKAAGRPIESIHSFLMSFHSIGNAIEAMMPHLINEGSNGSFTAYYQSAYLTATFNLPVDEDNTECGRPLCKVKTINTLSGFIQCGEATVDYPCFATEKTRILNYLTQGFFWE